MGVWTPGTRCASWTHNDDGASSFSEVWTLVSGLTLWNSLRDALFPSWGFLGTADGLWRMIRTIEFYSTAEWDYRMNHSDFYPKTVDCSHSIATNRMVSTPNDRFEYRHSKGSRMFSFPTTPAWPISSRLTLRYCYVIRRIVGDSTVGVPPVSRLFWIRRATFWAFAVALMTFY